jgi:hypothetical protein
VTFLSILQFLIFFCTGFEVLREVRTYNVVWVRTPYSLVRGYECSGEVFWVSSQVIKIWMQDVLTKTLVSTHQIMWSLTLEDYNLKYCILHFSWIVSLPYLLQTNWLYVLGSQYTLLFYIVFMFYYDLSRNILKKI